MSIYSLEEGVFDSEATALMAEAFEAACEDLHFPEDRSIRLLVAKRIVSAAKRGELDPFRLRSAAVVGMSDSAALTDD
jgi:hypothetical protein